MESSLLSKQQFDMARNASDIAGLDNLRQAAKNDDGKALQAAAEQFEGIFLRMMLKSMRDAQMALSDKDSPFNSQQVQFYRDMHDQQLASNLASSGGVGLAELIVQQMGPQQPNFMPGSAVRPDANLPVTEVSNTPLQTQAYKAPGFASPEEFVEHLLPVIKPVAEQLGADPKSLVAQAALETGWGKHMIHDSQGNNANNLFGIKADNSWQGKQVNVPTVEYHDGVAKKQSAGFRAYESVKESVQDYLSFLQQGRYAEAVEQAGNPDRFFNLLQQAGYATDPNYAKKVLNIMQRLVE